MTLDSSAIRARCEAATAGSWKVSGRGYICAPGVGDATRVVLEDLDMDPDDAEFIAHARSDIPALLDVNDRLRGVIDRLRGVIKAVDERPSHETFPSHAGGTPIIHHRTGCPGCYVDRLVHAVLATTEVNDA